MSSSDETTGLNLFDETASAVGNFPTALRGYDRTAVDDYVRSLEGRVVQAGHQSTDLQRQINDLQQQLEQTRHELDERPTGEVDYSSLGARAGHILKMAEEQAQEMLNQANVEANQLREAGRRDADQLRQQAETDGEQIRVSGRAELQQLRDRGQQQVLAEVDRARAEAVQITAAAEREAEALRRQAQQEADSIREAARLDGEEAKRAAENEAAQIRQQIAEERQAATAELKRIHGEAVTATGNLLSEATQHHQRAGEQLAVDLEAAAKARTDAEAEAERIRLEAKDESDRILAAAQTQAQRITRRTHQEFEWRKEQLRRETENLVQRKQAVLNQLQSLSALASQSAGDVPHMQPLADLSEDLEALAEEPLDTTPLSDPTVADPLVADPTAADADEPGTGRAVNAAGDAQGDEEHEPTVVVTGVRTPDQD